MPATQRCPKTSSINHPRPCPGLTFIELLLALAIAAVLIAAILPHLASDLPERLDAAAQVLVADLDYARALAVANNSKYRLTFEPSQNRYYLEHSGTDNRHNVLPRSPFRLNTDAPTRQTTDLSQLPLPAPGVRLAAAVVAQGGGVAASSLEFTPLGGTTSTLETVIWLACGNGEGARFISVHVDPVTGQVSVGPLRGQLPAAVETIADPIDDPADNAPASQNPAQADAQTPPAGTANPVTPP